MAIVPARIRRLTQKNRLIGPHTNDRGDSGVSQVSGYNPNEKENGISLARG